MKRLLVLCLFSTVAFAQKPDINNRDLRGPSIFVLTDQGYFVAADVDKTDATVPPGKLRIVLDPPATAGGRPIVRVIAPPASPPIVVGGNFCEREVTFAYAGTTYQLPEPPLPNTIVKMIWGGLEQEASDFSLSGQTVTVPGSGWRVGDRIRFRYFYRCQ